MVISQPAVFCLVASSARFVDSGLVRWLRRLAEPAPMLGSDPVDEAVGAAPTGAHAAAGGDPPPGGSPGPEASPLSGIERRARAAALRGLLLARQRRFEAAQRAFGEAVRLDPALDLASIPGFWELERSAHEAAIRAYEDHGQGRRAAILGARLQERFRPRLVPNRPSRPGRAPTAPVPSV